LKAWVQFETGRFDKARATAAQAKQILLAKLEEDHWRVAMAANVEGAALAELGAYEEAEQLLLSSNEVLADVPLPGVAEQSRARLAALYSSWGKEAEALKFASDAN
jgi:tetratricopeptide (TPR) repeat protein